MRLGELLVMNGIITEAQLEEVLKAQVQTRKKFGEILVEKNFITERQLVEVLEFQLGYPFVNLFETTIDMATVNMISESLARKHGIIPVERKGGKIKLAMFDPLNYEAIEEVRIATGMAVQPMIALKSEIDQGLNKYYGFQDSVQSFIEEIKASSTQEMMPEETETSDQSAPAVKLVNQLIHSAVQQGASDIHFDPQEREMYVRFRVDGVLHTEKTLPRNMQNVITARLKIISKLNIAERRLPQDGRIHMVVDNRKIDIRVSCLPSVFGECIVLRLLDQSAGIKQIEELGFSPTNRESFEKVLKKPNGIVLLTGPTGSGKTSTLYSALNRLNSADVKIITVEDPVEYRLPGITQVQVNAQIGLTFASGLRSILRQDPDIVMIGEMRDTETAEIAVRASQTGHLVLSTIHTNGAINTISRLVDMGIDPYLIASSLSCVVAQRLVRCVCRECSQSVPANEHELKLLQDHHLIAHGEVKQAEASGYGFFRNRSVENTKIMLNRGAGCSYCHKTGYAGRMAIHEVFVLDEEVRHLIAANRPLTEIKRHLAENGFGTMLEDGLGKVLNGRTTVEEVLKAVSDE
ncbi:GspE/PulE family protein [Gorillibacterium massiliense]|uniref:GspE/PulE family protein n=1 Tax=Gorillibacterium massiliense TaxID=1280390 RepID=UPI0004B80832|nr:ATPase, T2SS/T4P/T4SS family [Gorillibacterium massiliense]